MSPRETLVKVHPERDGHFRWRGDGVSRIEGLSDAVFGFALALLVAALGVPRTYADLEKMLVSFPAFAATFGMLYVVWSAQYKFFRRYGLEDARTIKLNVMLLLVVVFYVYPLMFLFNTFIALWLGIVGRALSVPVIVAHSEEAFRALRPEQWPAVMIVFAVGYVAVFAVFALLHRHALRCAASLDLDPVEELETRAAVREHLLNASVGVFSATLTLGLTYGLGFPAAFAAMLGGMSYAISGPVMSVHFRRLRKARAALVARGVTIPLETASD